MSADLAVATGRRWRRSRPLLVAAVTMGILAAVGAGVFVATAGSRGQGAPLAPLAPPPSSAVAALTERYLRGPGTAVLELHQVVSAWVGHPDGATCAEMAAHVASLGGAQQVDTAIAGAPDPVLVDFATDEIAVIGGTTQDCATTPRVEQSRLAEIDAAVMGRLDQLGVTPGLRR